MFDDGLIGRTSALERPVGPPAGGVSVGAFGLSGGGFGAAFGVAYCWACGSHDDQRRGEEHLGSRRKGGAKATSPSPAASPAAFAVIDGFPVDGLLAAQRDGATRQLAEEIPFGAALTNSPIRVRPSRI